MKKKTGIRVAGFAGALCASAALIGISVSGTGAYFTDSHDGSISASTGQIKIDTTDGNLNFTDLLPGEYQTKTVNYTARPVGGTEDVWLVFPTTGGTAPNTNPSEAFTGRPDDAVGGGLGRYGHFALSSSGGANFTSYNLNNPGTTPGHTGPSCNIDANGSGGSNAQQSAPGDLLDFCAPANAILLDSGLSNGQVGHVDLTFGFTPKLTSQSQYASSTPIVAYKIVATQHGIRPDNAFNPAS